MARSLLRSLARGLLARLAGYGMLGLGFWLLFQGIGQSGLVAGIGIGLGGTGLILAGMYILVSVRRNDPGAPQPNGGAGSPQQEVTPFDPIDGSDQDR